jgi:cyclophilin family peptidyl-prolyl cis-trans isomerase
MNRSLLLTALASFITLTACTPAPDPDVSNIRLWQSPPAEINQTQTNQNQQQQQVQPNTQRTQMKTLADFESIPATQATIVTSKGNITFELYRDQAPLTTANFLNLAKDGFYDGIVFHRVIPDFMAQVGDPKTKDPALQAQWGTGGPGYSIADEFGPGLKHDSEGIVSMANSGPNTGGSQFFITYGPTTWLDGKHAIFGKVTQGLDVLNQITQGDTIISVSYQ